MVRRLHAHGFDQVDALLAGLARSGWWVDRGAKVLDFGCGAGEHVYGWRDHGYDAYGFDLIDTVALRAPADRRYFSYLEKPRINPSDTHISDAAVRTPYEAASFDLIYSLTVIEHCYALDGMMAECARLLRPGGVSMHLYPSRNQAIEPHFFVPFGGRIQEDWWLRLWARLGVRNAGQIDMTTERVVEHNRQYLDTGVAYRPDADVMSIAYRHFGQVAFVDKSYHDPDPVRCKLSKLRAALRSNNICEQLSALIPGRVLLTSLPKH